jgi:hypothetical protein
MICSILKFNQLFMEFVFLVHLYLKFEMKNYRLLFVVLAISCLGLFGQKTKKQIGSTTPVLKKISISGVVMQTSSYCGGAEMPPELFEEYSKPRPYNGKVFYIRKGKVNSINEPVVLSFTVNASGTFSFQLPAGIYSIFQEPQLKPFNKKEYPLGSYTSEEIECLKKWWLKPYFVLEIKEKDITNLNFNFHHECFAINDIPCLQYYGPMPP